MTDLNTVNLIGRIIRDVQGEDFGYIQGGLAKLNTAIAVNKSVKRKDKWQDEVSFFNLTLWGKTAEIMKEYLTKGQQVAVSGHLQQQRWKDQNGNNRSQIAIVTESIQLLGGKKDGGNNAPAQQAAPANGGDFPEDIPF